MFFLRQFRRIVTKPAKFMIVNSVMITFLFSVFSALSLVGYITLYQTLMPTVQLERPLHFKYEMRPCKQNELCEHPVAKVLLPADGEAYPVLTAGTEYKIELALELPESEANMEMGMFMTSMQMQAANGEALRNAQRSAGLVYKSSLIRTLHTFLALPSLLFGENREKQLVRLVMFDRYVESGSKFTYSAHVEVHNSAIQIYSASVRIFADFGGIRYMMYYWPLTSAVLGVLFNFSCLWLVVALFWLRARLCGLRGALSSKETSRAEKNNTSIRTSAPRPVSDPATGGEDELDQYAPKGIRSSASGSGEIITPGSKFVYARLKLAGLVDYSFQWLPLPIPQFVRAFVVGLVSPMYGKKKLQ